MKPSGSMMRLSMAFLSAAFLFAVDAAALAAPPEDISRAEISQSMGGGGRAWSNDSLDDAEQIRQVLARYVRAVDLQDGDALTALYTPKVRWEMVFHENTNRLKTLMGPLTDPIEIGRAAGNPARAYRKGEWRHHMTFDHIIEVKGDSASLSAQFMVISTQADEPPVGGYAAGDYGLKGVLKPVHSGYYDIKLKKISGEWKISEQRILMDIPYVSPPQAPVKK